MICLLRVNADRSTIFGARGLAARVQSGVRVGEQTGGSSNPSGCTDRKAFGRRGPEGRTAFGPTDPGGVRSVLRSTRDGPRVYAPGASSIARALIGRPEVVLVDLRDENERRRHGVIPGSVHAPYQILDASPAACCMSWQRPRASAWSSTPPTANARRWRCRRRRRPGPSNLSLASLWQNWHMGASPRGAEPN